MGELLNNLLDLVIETPELNDKEKLISLANQLVKPNLQEKHPSKMNK